MFISFLEIPYYLLWDVGTVGHCLVSQTRTHFLFCIDFSPGNCLLSQQLLKTQLVKIGCPRKECSAYQCEPELPELVTSPGVRQPLPMPSLSSVKFSAGLDQLPQLP